ncbi:MAG: glucosamine-6-phosphate deaminase [Candidatus Limiplasma sp.]|nr:glucosamine-6-phosphate deaminase [Candidatus Limiplasma sp.]
MEVHIFDNASQVAQAAALLMAAQVLRKPGSVLGLATGSSPIPTYQELIRLHRAGVVDFSKVRTFNLDEYCRLPQEHPCSYHFFMKQELFDHLNIPAENTRLPDGNAENLIWEAARYDAAIVEAGGIDMQLLGIGHNAHIGFNEPADELIYGTHVSDLTPSTIQANRRFFDREEDVPRQAVTMGIGAIMNAACVLLIATGQDKAQAVYESIRGEISPRVPASVLRGHSNALFLLDKEAAELL